MIGNSFGLSGETLQNLFVSDTKHERCVMKGVWATAFTFMDLSFFAFISPCHANQSHVNQSHVLGWLDLCVISDNAKLRNGWPIVICHVRCCILLLNCGWANSVHSWLDWDIEVVLTATGTEMGREGCVGWRETFISLVTENVEKISVPSNEM